MFPLTTRDTKGLYKFGQYTFYARKHAGQDYRCKKDTYHLPFSGTVKVGYGFEGGYCVQLTRDNGDVITGRHFSKLLITNGRYEEGTPAAITGNTGAFTTGEHLHLEVKQNGKLIDPEGYDWLPLSFPVTIRVCLLMNYPKPWQDTKPFMELQDWFFRASEGKIQLALYPVYTPFKDSPLVYESGDGSEFYSVVERKYFNDIIKTHSFGNAHITALVISKADWKGKPFNNPGNVELGWYYKKNVTDNSHLPPKLFVVCDEGEMSSFSFLTAFTEYLRHELCHFLYDKGHPSGFDFTHRYQYEKTMEKVFADVDYHLLYRNL